MNIKNGSIQLRENQGKKPFFILFLNADKELEFLTDGDRAFQYLIDEQKNDPYMLDTLIFGITSKLFEMNLVLRSWHGRC